MSKVIKNPVNQAKNFYDNFHNTLLSDFCFGNPRIESAINFAVTSIPPDAKVILDIGCGIGWSTQEYRRAFPHAKITGIDLSDNLVDIARKLTDDSSISFQVQDLLDWNPTEAGKIDCIVMIDVYGHIPASARDALHQKFNDLLSENGKLILTCPSPKHQEYLRTYNPEGLQPVDEDVTEENAKEISTAINATEITFTPVNIWNDGDYNHITISRSAFQCTMKNRKILPKETRQSLVKRKLRIRPISRGVFSKVDCANKIVIATPNLDTYSETFIKRHITELPFDVSVLHGGDLCLTEENKWLLQRDRPLRIAHRVLRSLKRFDYEQYRIKKQAQHLRSIDAKAVLAEYGTTATRMLDACIEADVPLVAHFHGFDAHREDVLTKNKDEYLRLFDKAAAIIGVSQYMCQTLIEMGASKEKVHYIPYSTGVTSKERFHPEKKSPSFLAVGRFVDKKAPHLTLIAFSKVLACVPEAKLEMFGEGELFDSCQQLATALHIENAVTFHGSKKHSSVLRRMKECRCFVQHSVTAISGDSEGTPVAVTEAQALGIPVVATRHAGIPDVVVHEETGLLVDELDVDSMADAMIRIAQDGRLVAKMSVAAARRISTKFGHDQTIGKLAALMQSVCR